VSSETELEIEIEEQTRLINSDGCILVINKTYSRYEEPLIEIRFSGCDEFVIATKQAANVIANSIMSAAERHFPFNDVTQAKRRE
jgi:hypothetical protein